MTATGSPDDARLTPRFRPRQVSRRAPCQGACALGGDVRDWIAIVAQRGKLGISREDAYARAWERIVDKNPFPSVMGRVCPHPCESECNRAMFDEPIAINGLERFLGDWAIAHGLQLRRLETDAKPERIAVVGAGPSGLSFAYQLARRGYRVTVYERQTSPGGMLRRAIPDYRLPPDVLDAEIGRIQGLGVELLLGVTVGRDVSLAGIRRDHAACYVAIGAQVGRGLGVPGDDAADSAIGYLALAKNGGAPPLGRRVAVIGGGNTAIDAARTARRAGADVTILYRRTRDEMPAVASEVEDALGEGVRIELLVAPIGLERRDGVLVLTCERMRLGEPDASGRARPVAIAGSAFETLVDRVIAAVSQGPEWGGIEGVGAGNGWLTADARGAVGDGLWAGGDVLGLGIVADAIRHGRRAAEALHASLRGLPAPSAEEIASVAPEEILTAFYPTTPRARPARLPVADALSAPRAEVQHALAEDQALAEVSRCFSCGSCFGCEQCVMYCNAQSYTRRAPAAPGAYFSLALEECRECGKCVDICPCRYLQLSPEDQMRADARRLAAHPVG